MPTTLEMPNNLATADHLGRPRNVSRKEAAHLLGIGLRTFDRYVAHGHLTPVRFGNRTVFRGEEIERLRHTGIEASRTSMD